ncbi:MAG: hypothetical protein ABL897_15010 [Hyphomicrobium sp.]
MKSKDFASVLLRYADLLHSANANAASDCVRQIAFLFGIAPTATVAATLKKLEAALSQLPTGETSLSDGATALANLHEFLAGQAKPALLTDLALTRDFLKTGRGISLVALLEAAPRLLVKPVKLPPPAVRFDIVEKYVRRLEQALGDENGFAGLHKEMESNADVSNREADEIAKRFTGKGAKSKATALKKVWARHHNLMTFRAKSESRAGRSAA